MLGFFFLLVAIIFVGVWFTLRNKRLEWIKKGAIVSVQGATNRYVELPLGNYGIPLKVRNNAPADRVQVIFPRLTEEGDVEYIYSWHGLLDVQLPELSDGQNAPIQYKLASELAPVILEHLRAEKEVYQLEQQREKLDELADLVSTSDFYAGHVGLYERAIAQVDRLLQKAEALQNIYVRLIRETLIGIQISSYDAEAFLTSKDFEREYQHLRNEFYQLKDTATAYSELMQTNLK